MLQDKIALAYQKQIRRELKKAATDLSLSYQTNQSQLGFADIQNNHKQSLIKILNDLALETITRFSKLDVFGKKDIFAVQIANNIYAELAQNVRRKLEAKTLSVKSIRLIDSLGKSKWKTKLSYGNKKASTARTDYHYQYYTTKEQACEQTVRSRIEITGFKTV